MNEYPDFEQDYYSRTARELYKSEHDSIGKMNCLAYYDRTYQVNTNYYDFVGSVLTCLNEIYLWYLLCGSKG